MKISYIGMFFKAKTLTAHAPCHVTCDKWVQNDHIFGIPEAILFLWAYDDDQRPFIGEIIIQERFWPKNFEVRFLAQFSTLGGFFRS